MKKKYYARRRRSRRTVKTRFFIIIGLLVAALAVGIFFIVKAITDTPGSSAPPSDSAQLTPPDTTVTLPTDEPPPTDEPTPTPAPSMAAELVPHATSNTDPAKVGVTYEVMVDGTVVDSYTRPDPISFGTGAEYTALEGIIGFRGNNYRDMPSWGTVTISENKLEAKNYDKKTSAIGSWGGAAWTGQPLIVKWPAETRAKMTSLKEEFRSKDDFVEVIYATLDGRIYFMELSSGKKTRDYIDIGAPTKGTATLDPRGYPIIYVGQGLQADGDPNKYKDMYFRIYSLTDNKLLYKFGAESADPFAYRKWQAYDSSALIHAGSDTLIEPGENGILYTIKLNTDYNAETGVVKMNPGPMVKYRYTSDHNKNADSGRWGMENSAVGWRNYLFFTDNAGILQCVDLNTMKLVYANNLDDDSDVSMVLEEDIPNQKLYLYTGCEYDELVRPLGDTGPAYARKIDALTGEILWTTEYEVKSDKVDGGILASPVLGRDGTNMEGLIIYNVTAAVKGDSTTSYVVALDKETGDEKWRYDMDVAGWSPSSPVSVYTADGKGYIVQCDRGGEVALIDGATGAEVAKLSLYKDKDEDNNFEATPAIYGNTIVVASRDKNIFFIEIK